MLRLISKGKDHRNSIGKFHLYINVPQFNDLYFDTLISTTEENETQVELIDKKPIRIFFMLAKYVYNL